MNLIDNINFIREKLPLVWQEFDTQRADRGEIKTTQAKNGLPTLYVEVDGREVFLHSKYNPLQEAERLVDRFENVEEYEHVLFYGIGLGYHIEYLLKKYPHLTYSVYEPNEEIFLRFLEYRELNQVMPLNRLRHIRIQKDKNINTQELADYLKLMITDKVLFVSLPSYERIFSEEYRQFAALFKDLITNKTSQINAEAAFEKRWIINSLINLPKVMSTPNILHDIDKDVFKNKPAIIVAAGPSLEEDIEHIRFIQEHSLAFVFAVGSAINVLLKYGIFPDAACTYDPTPRNARVFERVVQEKIDTIPLIFGSSVGFETLQNYPGPMVHMLTSQDTISTLLFKSVKNEEFIRVNDAPSIAVITLQLLFSLGCNPIILAGQNLAYKNEKRYASGIPYYDANNNVDRNELENLLQVEDIYGNKVYTTLSFDRMRKNMEIYTINIKGIEIINTTKGGAKIAGTRFQPIEDVIKERLNIPIDKDWLKIGGSCYDREFFRKQFYFFKEQLLKLPDLFDELQDVLKNIEEKRESQYLDDLNSLFAKLDKIQNKLGKNIVYKNMIRPMNRVQFENLTQQIVKVKFDKNLDQKAKVIVEHFGKFLNSCRLDLSNLMRIWTNIEADLFEKKEVP